MNIIYLHSARLLMSQATLSCRCHRDVDHGVGKHHLCPIPVVGHTATGTAGEKVRCLNKDKCKGLVLGKNKWCISLVRNV